MTSATTLANEVTPKLAVQSEPNLSAPVQASIAAAKPTAMTATPMTTVTVAAEKPQAASFKRMAQAKAVADPVAASNMMGSMPPPTESTDLSSLPSIGGGKKFGGLGGVYGRTGAFDVD